MYESLSENLQIISYYLKTQLIITIFGRILA